MKIEGRPYYSATSIEDKSKKLLTYYSADYFKTIKPTPLIPIANFLKEKHNLVFNFDVPLGFNDHNTKILGAFNPIKRVILIDSSLQQDQYKFNFTLAHELGHLALHREIKIIREPNDGNDNSETINETFSMKKELKTDSDWIEWQANFYASALLMPSDIFRATLVFTQKELGISKAGKIYVDNQPCNEKSLYQIIGKLSEFFNASKAAVEYRLYYLKLIDDHRKGLRIGDYFRINTSD